MMTADHSTRFSGVARLYGTDSLERFRNSHVAVVGIGGLGTHVVQQLALHGVSCITLIDKEEIDETID